MMRWIVGSSLYFRFLVITIAGLLMFFGTQHIQNTPVDVFPEFAPPIVEVQTETPGLSTEEVESLVTIMLESSLNSTPNLDILRSKSVPGVSQVTLIFKPGTDELLARQQVQERLNVAIKSLPTWAGIPWILQPLSATSRSMHIGLTSDKYSLTDLSMITYWTIRWRLMSVPGVANVIIWGDRFKQMQVQIDPAKLLKYRVTLDDTEDTVSNALDFGLLKFTDAAKTRVGGFIETANQRMLVHHEMPVIEPGDLEKIPLDKKKPGGAITIGDLGQVVWGHQPLIGEAVINDKEGLLLIVEKFPWANTLAVTRGVEAALEELKPGLPDIQIKPDLFRPASFIEIAVHNLVRSLIISCLLVMLVLVAFLYEWRTTLISLIAIPLSLITAALILDIYHITINTMILAGFVIAIGGVVDDAIIDVENIVRRLRRNIREKTGRAIPEVILDASLEIRGAIIYAVLIDIAVLLPIFFLNGVSGAFFKPLVTAYALALLASMVVALTVTPALCLLLLRKAPLEKRESPLLLWIQRHYDKAMSKVIAIRTPLPVYVTLIALIVIGLSIVPFLGESLFPEFKESYFLVHWVTMPATTGNEVVRITKRLSAELRKIPGVLNFGSHIGRGIQGEEISGINFAENWISVDPSLNYNKAMSEIEKTISGYPGLYHDVQTYLNERIDEVVAGSSFPITVRIFGEDLKTLRDLAEKVKNEVSQVDDANDVHTELQVDVPHIHVETDIAKANKYGLKPGDVRRAAATLIAGTEVSDIHRGAKVYDIMVWGTPDTRHSLQSIRDLLISTPTGDQVKLSDVANVKILPTPNLIVRENNSRRIDVGLDSKNRDLSDVVSDVKDRIAGINFPLGYHAEVIGEYQEREAAAKLLFGVALVSGILVLILLQTAFKNWRLAFLAFFTLPSALVGGLIAAFLTGGIITLGSLVGFFTVFGIAARNGIMLINHYQYIEEKENEPFGPNLVLRGAKERLAPILITALVAALALIPLIMYGDIPGQEIEYPMAIVILGGLFTSTLLNLFIMPQLYLRFGKKRAS